MPNPLTRISRTVRVLLLLVISTASIATVMAQGFGPAGPSPAQGHAGVVATGTVNLTESSARWHVTRHVTEEGGSTYASISQGFLIAEVTPLLITLPDGSQLRLAGGEALSVAENTEITVDTFGAPDSFIFVQTLPESGDQLAGASDRLLTSASFATEPGAYSTSLIRDVLSEEEEGTLPGGVVPTAIYVTVGEIEVTSDRGTITLLQGDSATFEGDLTITAIADGSTYYAGFIGTVLPQAATPVPATPEATAVPATPEPTAVPATPEAPVEVPATPEAPAEPAPTALPNEGDSYTQTGASIALTIRGRS